jgi:hypothetical protein
MVFVFAGLGVSIELAGNRVSAEGPSARILVVIVGAVAVVWSASSLRNKSFEVSRLELVPEAYVYRRPCPRTINVIDRVVQMPSARTKSMFLGMPEV